MYKVFGLDVKRSFIHHPRPLPLPQKLPLRLTCFSCGATTLPITRQKYWKEGSFFFPLNQLLCSLYQVNCRVQGTSCHRLLLPSPLLPPPSSHRLPLPVLSRHILLSICYPAHQLSLSKVFFSDYSDSKACIDLPEFSYRVVYKFSLYH